MQSKTSPCTTIMILRPLRQNPISSELPSHAPLSHAPQKHGLTRPLSHATRPPRRRTPPHPRRRLSSRGVARPPHLPPAAASCAASHTGAPAGPSGEFHSRRFLVRVSCPIPADIPRNRVGGRFTRRDLVVTGLPLHSIRSPPRRRNLTFAPV